MKYISTRGEAPELDFEGVLLTGLATDGGLYVPTQWPRYTTNWFRDLQGKSYETIAYEVMSPFVGEVIQEEEFRSMIAEAYSTFGHPAVVPLKQLDDNQWLLELFHGPTLAFKDVAMQILARLMDWTLAKRGEQATIVGATSGDTGGAAIEAFKASRYASIFILHPHGRVSEVQRRQMTTVAPPSVNNIALEGTFDDCQVIVKALFNDLAFREQVNLAGVNSINWARIMAQIVYYVSSAVSLGAPDRAVGFSVPTGNFGDIFAGYAAKKMGLPISRLVIATNINDILDRTLKTGRYEVREVAPSSSPSMDIQVSSNFERLLFETCDRDAAAVRRLMASLTQSSTFTLSKKQLDTILADFASDKVDEAQVAETIQQTLANTGELLDPHTAVGYATAKRFDGENAMITLATAHPAKFPDVVHKASSIRPSLPSKLSGLLDAQERYTVLPNNKEAVKAFILRKSAAKT